ncbi:hypothetical protein [Aquabacterium sp.]|uniref:hypothetical protein n=1 Tax=Aquabacterium sp. TaxID=1872578 RepID=UPI003783ACC9
MKKLKQAWSLAWAGVAAAALLAAPWAQAANAIGTPTTYSGLVWLTAFNADGLTSCDQLVLDATGDLVRSDALVVYGALNCHPGVYGVTGSVFTANDGTLNLTLQLAGYTVSCPRISGYVGGCTVYDANWVVRGSGSVQLL